MATRCRIMVMAPLAFGSVLVWAQVLPQHSDQRPAAYVRSPQEQLEAMERAAAVSVAKRAELAPILALLSFRAGEYSKAESYALEALSVSGSKGSSNARGVVFGNEVLGLLALKQGNMEIAKLRLLDSARTSGSPTLRQFGPNMELAKALLERGERDTVVEYLELCKGLWPTKEGLNSLLAWQGAIRAGAIPDFGRQLYQLF